MYHRQRLYTNALLKVGEAFEGLKDGLFVGADPLGIVFSYFVPSATTVGASGLRKTRLIREEIPINLGSKTYHVAKVIGASALLFGQYEFYGAPQAFSIAINSISYYIDRRRKIH